MKKIYPCIPLLKQVQVYCHVLVHFHARVHVEVIRRVPISQKNVWDLVDVYVVRSQVISRHEQRRGDWATTVALESPSWEDIKNKLSSTRLVNIRSGRETTVYVQAG